MGKRNEEKQHTECSEGNSFDQASYRLIKKTSNFIPNKLININNKEKKMNKMKQLHNKKKSRQRERERTQQCSGGGGASEREKHRQTHFIQK